VELAKIRDHVMACTNIEQAEKVKVDTYWDVMPTLSATEPAAANALTFSVSSHAKEVAVGVLAVMSLLMVMFMVRKSGPVQPATAPAAAAPTPTLGGVEDVAGEASEGAPALDGMELDEDVIRTQQMIEQVATMVKENPDAAASLVKRWMNK
jgi:flagellar biosynthesis/type III secretory pathway M-ring protein FliF/YscJ